jgi:hypothetical protein
MVRGPKFEVFRTSNREHRTTVLARGPLDSASSRVIYIFHTEKSARAATRYSKTVNKNNKEVYYDSRTVESVS